MLLEFEKWHGAKNDFVLIWLQGDDQVVFDSLTRQAPQICSRDGSGVAADGILVLHTSRPNQALPDRLSIINSDGSLATTCGNGIRCAALSILKRHRDLAPTEIPDGFALPLSIKGTVHCTYVGRGQLSSTNYWPLVSVSMGVPQINDQCSQYADAKQEVKRISSELKLPQLNQDWAFVDIGNEHLVFFLDEADRALLHRVGPAFQKSKFWDGINVHLAVDQEVDNKIKTDAANRLGHKIEELYNVLVWERGAGETQACGSGACSVARAAYESGLVDRCQWLGIQMPGGLLFTQQMAEDEPVKLAGPGCLVFEGTLEI